MGKSVSTFCPSEKKGEASSLRKLIHEAQSSDDDNSMDDSTTTANTDPFRPWYADFKNYIDTLEVKPPPGMSTVQWWSVSIFHYVLLFFHYYH
jgi:hypothetical protein